MNTMQKFLDFLVRLEEAALPYSLEHSAEDTIMVLVAIEGERWEVEFAADGDVRVEVFYSAEAEIGLEGEEALERLFSDDDEELEEDLDEELDEDDFDEDDDEDEDDLDHDETEDDEDDLEEEYEEDHRR